MPFANAMESRSGAGFPTHAGENAAMIEAMARQLAADENHWTDPDKSWDMLLDGERARYRRRAEALLHAAERATQGHLPGGGGTA